MFLWAAEWRLPGGTPGPEHQATQGHTSSEHLQIISTADHRQVDGEHNDEHDEADQQEQPVLSAELYTWKKKQSWEDIFKENSLSMETCPINLPIRKVTPLSPSTDSMLEGDKLFLDF